MKKIIAIIILLSIVLASCKKNVLDIDPQIGLRKASSGLMNRLIKAYHNELYNAIPHGFYIHMYSKYTDEAYNSAPCCGADIFKLNTYNARQYQPGGERRLLGRLYVLLEPGLHLCEKNKCFFGKNGGCGCA